MNDFDLLMTAICQNPDEDTPRLVMADWLQDNGQEVRAEFIRVQCQLAIELAGTEEHHHHNLDMILDPGNRDQQIWKHHIWNLQKREKHLLDANRERWLRVPCCDVGPHHGDVCSGGRVQAPNSQFTVTCKACMGSGDIGGLEWIDVVFRRGFPDEVKGCRLADVFEQETTSAMKWVPTDWILRVFRHHPITRLPLVDRRPGGPFTESKSEAEVYWEEDNKDWQFDLCFWYLPKMVYHELEDYNRVSRRSKDFDSGQKIYRSREAGDEAFARASARVIRRLTFPAPVPV